MRVGVPDVLKNLGDEAGAAIRTAAGKAGEIGEHAGVAIGNGAHQLAERGRAGATQFAKLADEARSTTVSVLDDSLTKAVESNVAETAGVASGHRVADTIGEAVEGMIGHVIKDKKLAGRISDAATPAVSFATIIGGSVVGRLGGEHRIVRLLSQGVEGTGTGVVSRTVQNAADGLGARAADAIADFAASRTLPKA